MVTYVKGDATRPQGDGTKIIAHVCNNIGAWGKGFVLALDKLSPEPRKVYRDLVRELIIFGNKPTLTLGTMTLAEVERGNLYVANMVAQRGLRSATNPVPLDYDALEKSLETLAVTAEIFAASVHMPRIGCGLAGGNWDVVESIINRVLTLRDIDVTVYDL